MSDYVSSVTLDVNGTEIDDFKSFTDNERELHKPVNLMNTTGFMKATQRPGCKVDYVVPVDGEFDWEDVKDGRLSVEYENGKRVTFTGVHTLKIGEAKVDGDNEVVRTIELGAKKRVKE
ncbi:MAG: hypothetical protein L3J69_06115 [Desulfobacula sp.]|nr:hypothetical protein [Desulfobacula sp.]